MLRDFLDIYNPDENLKQGLLALLVYYADKPRELKLDLAQELGLYMNDIDNLAKTKFNSLDEIIHMIKSYEVEDDEY